MKMIVIFAVLFFSLFTQAGVVHATANYTVQASDDMVFIEGSGISLYLPQCSASNDGERHTFQAPGPSHSGTVYADTGDTIVGSAGFYMQYFQSNTVVCSKNTDDWVGIGFF